MRCETPSRTDGSWTCSAAVGFETARLLGFEESRGALTFHAVFDPALILDLCGRVGATTASDERVAELARFLRGLAGPAGLWEYAANPAASRWVSFDIACALAAAETAESAEWEGGEPRTPFAAYPRRKKRY